MKSIFTNEVRAMVADTYLSYTSDIDGAEAFKRFISRPASLLDVRRDPKFIAFTDNELIDEMKLSIGTLIDPPICGVLDPLKTVFFVLKQSDYFLLCAPRPV